MSRWARLFAVALFFAAAAPLLASPAFVFTTPGLATTDGSFVFGIRFDVLSTVTVSSLGYYDDSTNGFLNSHEVGLYSGTGTLLASTTVLTSDPLTGLFRYHAITPVVLSPGTYEVVGVSHSDLYTWDAPGFSTNPAVAYVGDTYDRGTTLFYPTGEFDDDLANGFWGPNLMVDAVPEPASAGLILMGLLGLVAYRRRAAAR